MPRSRKKWKLIDNLRKSHVTAATKWSQGKKDPPSSLQRRTSRWRELHGTVRVPSQKAGFWPQWRAFVGPAILISVGYMDPGNWGTDLQGGAQFKYGLIWVVGLASLMAIFLQVISARLGVATGKDLAQCCRDWYPALDALAKLARDGNCDRHDRSGRIPWAARWR